MVDTLRRRRARRLLRSDSSAVLYSFWQAFDHAVFRMAALSAALSFEQLPIGIAGLQLGLFPPIQQRLHHLLEETAQPDRHRVDLGLDVGIVPFRVSGSGGETGRDRGRRGDRERARAEGKKNASHKCRPRIRTNIFAGLGSFQVVDHST